ncbi:hypothetical protein AWM68_15950 [Fictibacillus phosphorivorans]|uniref:DUF4367 domain-containing protein n=2 Tax=Fictibacillus phosphorivorans TaxID=1221500 RepID=A0A165MTC4_9BACL|nr:hypothetical protein AWM68_15950 [Fictibacillus phosphorivorans]
MNYYKSLVLFVVVFLFFTNNMYSVSAKNQPLSIEELYKKSGFKSDEALIREYEKKYRLKIGTPKKFPFIISDMFGKIDHTDKPPKLELAYINNKIPKDSLRIFIRPVLSKLQLREGDEIYHLKDGTKAIYRSNYGIAYVLEFQKNGVEYFIGIGKSTDKTITVNNLMEIAESIN